MRNIDITKHPDFDRVVAEKDNQGAVESVIGYFAMWAIHSDSKGLASIYCQASGNIYVTYREASTKEVSYSMAAVMDNNGSYSTHS